MPSAGRRCHRRSASSRPRREQEDVQSFAWSAALALRAALGRAGVVTACELLTAHQAATLAAGPRPGGCARLLAELAGLIEPVEADRPVGADIGRLAQGSWLPGSDAVKPALPIP